MSRSWRGVAGALALGLLATGPAAGGEEAPEEPVFTGLQVNSTADAPHHDPGSGVCETAPGNEVCTLRAAIQEANANPDIDVVVVPGGAYLLTAGVLDVTTDLLLAGDSTASVVIDAGGVDRAISVVAGAAVTIEEVTVTGGGIRSDGDLTLDRVTLTANTPDGAHLTGSATIENTTVSGNDGHGLVVAGPDVALRSTTISDNATGIGGNGSATALNTLVAGNDVDCAGDVLVSGGHNLDGDGTCALDQDSDLSFTDPRLAPLALDDGATPTHALRDDSPAIHSGPPRGPGCPATDQRGQPRPQGPACDIGAYEADYDGPWVFAPAGTTTDRFPKPSEPELVDIEARDGIMLHARVFRPDTSGDPAWRTPVILVHSPYYNGAVWSPFLVSGHTRSLDLVDFFTPKGYTVVLSDVRGTGHSGGCGEQDGINQQLDFKTLVEHFASEPWSNGNVGSYGKSYDAETQHAGAIHAPKGLATMVSVAGISGLYDVAYYDGVPLRLNGLLSAAVYAPFGLDPPSREEYLVQSRFGRGVCEPANFVNGADQRGDMTPYWAEREFRFGANNVQASILYVMGLTDFTVSPIAIDGWYDELGVFKRAVFGQWAHFYPYDAPNQWARDDWYDTVHAWYDHELLGLDTGVEHWPPVQIQSEHNSWRAVDSFAGMGTVEELEAVAESAVSFAEDEPVTIDFDPVDDFMHVSGQAILDATITLDRPQARFAVTLEEVDGFGSARTLTRGYLSAMHRSSLTDPELVPLLEPVDYRIRTYPFDRTVAPGSRLRLVLAGSDGWTTPAGTAYTAAVEAATLHLPVVTAPCGVLVDQRADPLGEVPDCPAGIPGD